MSTGKKIAGVVFLIIVLVAAFTAIRFLGSGTGFDEKSKNIYIRTGSSFTDVVTDVDSGNIVKNIASFQWLAARMDYPDNIKAGKYTIQKGSSIFTIIKLLKSGRQTPVRLVINKLRTKEDFARKIASNFECDSTNMINFIMNEDSLRPYQLDTNTVMTAVIPNTYNLLWNTSPDKIFQKLYDEHDIFWNDERKQKAAALNLTPAKVYTIASIVEEETNKQDDKGKIASVYINRMEIGMKLGADPTVKYAMRDFGLKRIYHKHLLFPSPYNTYQNPGLPPGPICTPSIKTIDAVLNSPSTSYLYFVAKPDFNGYSNFATSYSEHLKYARAYQTALDRLIKSRAVSE